MADANDARTHQSSDRDLCRFLAILSAGTCQASTRAIHYVGTALATLCVLGWLIFGNLWFVPAAVLSGYAFAWIGHFAIEKNRPATFTYPLWSLISDYRMAWLWLTGQLGAHLACAGVVSAKTRAPR